MCGDMDQVRLIQEMLGYCLIPGNSAQKCFLLVGKGGAGKSVLLNVIGEILLGSENVSNVSWQALNEKFKIAELVGKLANIFADLPTQNIDDTGIFKALVGEDSLTVERKFKNPFSFRNIAKLIFSCNNIPNNYGDRSEGFYRRLIIIRFLQAVPEERRDPNLLDKIREEADGIFLYALEGLHRLMANQYRFGVTQTNLDDLQRYREDNDSVLSFVRDRCMLDADKAVWSSEIYAAYKGYCEEEGMRPCGHNNFTQRVKLACPGVMSGHDSTGNRRILKGIRLNDSTR
jgi:putative DNA primase/helicase